MRAAVVGMGQRQYEKALPDIESALRLVPDQRLTFHPNISFRGPQVLMVRTS